MIEFQLIFGAISAALATSEARSGGFQAELEVAYRREIQLESNLKRAVEGLIQVDFLSKTGDFASFSSDLEAITAQMARSDELILAQRKGNLLLSAKLQVVEDALQVSERHVHADSELISR